MDHPNIQRRRRSNRRRQGMTLIEIMIVLVIMSLVATAASFAIIPALQRSKIKQTTIDAKKVASAAEMYMAENDDCPSVDDLVNAKILKGSTNTKDAWDNDFQIDCDEDGAVARSPGPDGNMGSEDDIE